MVVRTISFDVMVESPLQHNVSTWYLPRGIEKVVGLGVTVDALPGQFGPGAFYYGTGVEGQANNPAFVQTLSVGRFNASGPSVVIEAQANEKIYLAYPLRHGRFQPTINGFAGGFSETEIDLYDEDTNTHEAFAVLESTHNGLGATKVTLTPIPE